MEKDAAKSEALYREDWSRFVNAVAKREPAASRSGGDSVPDPDAGPEGGDGAVLASLEFPGMTLRYTTDGSEPTPRSPS